MVSCLQLFVCCLLVVGVFVAAVVVVVVVVVVVGFSGCGGVVFEGFEEKESIDLLEGSCLSVLFANGAKQTISVAIRSKHHQH